MTILKALKDRIRSMGGETNATNIADAIKDLPKGGSSELPPEVTNAVETHGMGWTDEDETVHQIDEKYIPSSGSSELPPEVTNAVETNGMGWTDEDETVHQIDSKYIPSSGGISTYEFIVNISAESEETMVVTEANAAEVISKLENGDTVKFIIKQVENLEAEDYQILISSMDIMLAKTEGVTMIMYSNSGWGTLTGAMIDGVSMWGYEGL